MNCRVCQTEKLELIFENPHSPQTSHKYLAEGELKLDKRVNVRVLKCLHCGTVQLADKYAEDEYVSDYQRNITFSASAQAHMDQMAGKLAALGVTNAVEIGCGNGTFSKLLFNNTNQKVKITAFEPSKAAYQKALENGIDVHNRFFDSSLPQDFRGYDGFALRFVLEHLDNPQMIFQEIKARCRTGAVGLVEVPNAQKQFLQERWFDYFPEHILYFTPSTLANALETWGFEVLEVVTKVQDEFLAAVVRVPVSGKAQGPEQMKHKFIEMIEGTTYVWGASGGATTLLSTLFAENPKAKQIKYVIDSDVNKWGLYTSGAGVKIVPPEEIQKHPPDTVIIMPLSYEKEIRGQLKNLGYSGTIRCLRECLTN